MRYSKTNVFFSCSGNLTATVRSGEEIYNAPCVAEIKPEDFVQPRFVLFCSSPIYTSGSHVERATLQRKLSHSSFLVEPAPVCDIKMTKCFESRSRKRWPSRYLSTLTVSS